MATADSNNATPTQDSNPRKRKVMLIVIVCVVGGMGLA